MDTGLHSISETEQLQFIDLLIRRLISDYKPAYEGELFPFTPKDIRMLQKLENHGKPWKAMHYFWSGQLEECAALIRRLMKEVRKKKVLRGPYGSKGHLLRKMENLVRFLQFEIAHQWRQVQKAVMLQETGLGAYFYEMHVQGMKYQI
ncbi:MAG: hypothetical protein ACE5OZ_18330 [Candidatus Heimdallarchaeota archaeon]